MLHLVRVVETSLARLWDGDACSARIVARWGRVLPLLGLIGQLVSCTERAHLLGYDIMPTTNEVWASNDSSAGDAGTVGAATETSSAVSDSSSGFSSEATPSSATSSATDQDGGVQVNGPRNPANVLVDDLALDPTSVQTRLKNLFERLFINGNQDSERIFFEHGEDQAYVLDVLHDDTRMDAMGYGMLLTAQFDYPDEFARLWNAVQTQFRYATGPRKGYYRFSCATDFSACTDQIDSFGSFYVVTALFMASQRWANSSYHAGALEVLAAMRDKEVNGVATEGVLNLFTDGGIPRRIPLADATGTVSPVSLLPAFFEFWYTNTQDLFWHQAAESSRELLLIGANPDTGLTADVLTETGAVVEMPGMFREEAYPAGFQLALDAAWFPRSAEGEEPPEDYVKQVNRLLGFFNRQSATSYSALYAVDGTVVDEKTSMALVALNGAAAAIATLPSRDAFLQRAWETAATSGTFRFYDGIYQLLSLMFLGGELRSTF